MSIFQAFGAVVGAAHSAIEGLASLGLPVALAIVLFTLLVCLAISPLTYLQVRSGRRREALAPQVAALREKHVKDPSRLATETMALHRENGISPFAGLLPGLIQWPFFMVMYRVAFHAPAGDLLGVPLGAHLAAGWPVFAGLLMIAGAVAWVSSRRLTGFLRALPFLTVLTVAWLPLAGALYLVTSSSWTAAEQAFYRRPVLTGNS